jgi:hypothetical protein
VSDSAEHRAVDGDALFASLEEEQSRVRREPRRAPVVVVPVADRAVGALAPRELVRELLEARPRITAERVRIAVARRPPHG